MNLKFEAYFRVFCGKCNAEIDFPFVTIDNDIVYVEPCEKCLEQAKSEGYDDGHNTGYDEGYEEGRQDAEE